MKGKYGGPVPPAGLGREGAFYSDDQQRLFGVDRYGNPTERAINMKAKALKATTEKRSAEKQKELDLAAHQTAENAKVRELVHAGKLPKAALKYKDEGGQMHRVGYPKGFDPKTLKKSTEAHATLFDRKVAEHVAKRGRPNGAVTRGNGSFDKDAKITVLAKENPKKEGTASYERFKLYKTGMAVGDFFSAGGKVADLKWDTDRGFIKVGK